MIQEVIIKNFQAHKHTSLSFSTGVNVIKGTSAQGKTSIVRALRWVLKNRPQGFAFKSHFAGEKEWTEAVMAFTEGSYINRMRDDKQNEYLNQNGEVYKALRGEVPDEIQEILQLDDVNLLSQHDPYFMLQDTPGERGRKINAVVNLGIIDETLSKCASLIRNIRGKVEERSTQIEEYTSQLKNFTHVEHCERLVKEIDELSIKQEENIKTTGFICVLLKKLDDSKEKIQRDRDWLKIKPTYEDIKELSDFRKQLSTKHLNLRLLIDTINICAKKINKDKSWLKVQPLHEEIFHTIGRTEKLQLRIKDMSKLIQNIAIAKKVQNSACQTLKIARNKCNKTLKDAGICPLCGQKVGSDS